MKTHDLGKPFQCSTCNRGYVTAAALTAHMQNHKAQNQLAKRLKHFVKYQANCLPGLVPIDLIKSLVSCSQQAQQVQPTPPINTLQATMANGLLLNSANNHLPNSSPFLQNPVLSALPNNNLLNGQLNRNLPDLLQPIVSPNLLNPLPQLNPINSSLLPNNNNALNINLNSQFNINLPVLKNSLNNSSLIDNQLDRNASALLNQPSQQIINSNNKRTIQENEDNSNQQSTCKRLRTNSLSEKDDNSCSSFSYNSLVNSINYSVNGSVNDLEDEEEVDVTSFEEERSNSVNSLINNSLSSSANSTENRNLADLNGNNLAKADSTTAQTKSSESIKKANDQKKYSCRFCSNNFEYKRSRDRHEKSIHTAGKF